MKPIAQSTYPVNEYIAGGKPGELKHLSTPEEKSTEIPKVAASELDSQLKLLMMQVKSLESLAIKV